LENEVAKVGQDLIKELENLENLEMKAQSFSSCCGKWVRDLCAGGKIKY
jgi:hypothetical protein